MFFESSGRPINFDHNKTVVPLTEKPPSTEMARGYQWADDEVYGVWGNSADPLCTVNVVMNCNNYQGLYSFHPSGGNELFGDGSVSFVNDNVDLDTFISLYTRAADDIGSL
jgi:hypothetical protein